MQSLERQRVLAFFVQPWRFGYAVLEGPNNLLDWGSKRFLKGPRAACIPFSVKVARLLSKWKPDVIVIKISHTTGTVRKTKIIEKEAEGLEIPVHLAHGRELNDAFPSLPNRHARAKFISASIPTLAGWLPQKPKIWQSEPYQMSVFDSVAVGIAYYRQRDRFPDVTVRSNSTLSIESFRRLVG
ncbi:MAG TPA: hypothetical protein VFR24_25395 [Candidatus Angelobacter sp.]|nr:hypothetical protein [Candidatus Angelobacter sp.]